MSWRLKAEHPGLCVQAESEERHKAVDQLHTDIQTLSDLTVQADYNTTHDLPVTALLAVPDRSLAQQVHSFIDMQTLLQKCTVLRTSMCI